MPSGQTVARAAVTATCLGLCSDVSTAPCPPRPAEPATGRKARAVAAFGLGIVPLFGSGLLPLLSKDFCSRCGSSGDSAFPALSLLSGGCLRRMAAERLHQRMRLSKGSRSRIGIVFPSGSDVADPPSARLAKFGPRPPHHRRDRSGAHSVRPGGARAAATAAGSVFAPTSYRAVSASTATGTEGTRAAAAFGFGIVQRSRRWPSLLPAKAPQPVRNCGDSASPARSLLTGWCRCRCAL